MTATKIIIASVIAYAILFTLAYVLFLNTKFTGDAAGSGMAKGLTLIFGLGALFLLAIIVTIINIRLFSQVTQGWVKVISFVPLVLPTLLFLTDFVGLGRSSEPSIEEQAHRLTFEIKTTTPVENARLSFRSLSGSQSSKLEPIREEGGVYFYEQSVALFYGEDRKFSVHSNDFKTDEIYLVIPYEPEPLPFTEWRVLQAMKNNGVDSVTLEFRYTITR